MAAERYTLIYVDQVTGEHFNLQRTPVGSFITGTVNGARAQQIIAELDVDQTLEQLQAAR